MAKPIENKTTRAAAKMQRFADREAKTMGKSFVGDSFQNFQAKIGIGTNNLASGSTYGFNPITRNHVLLEYMYRGSWLVGQVVDCVADDMTRAGIKLSSRLPSEENEHLLTAMQRLGIWPSLNDTVKWSRLYGGCIAVLAIDGQDMSTPLNVKSIAQGQLKGLLVLDRWMVQPSLARSELVREFGPSHGLPMYYDTVQDAPVLPAMRIHHSRCLRLEGIKMPYWQRITENLWSISVVERMYDRMVAFDSTTQGAAQLVYKAYLRTLKVPQLRDIVAQGGPALDGLTKTINFMRLMQSIEGITVLDKEDEFETSEYSFGGLADVMLQFGQQISGATQIPLVRLFGQSPAGLSATGESDLRNYYDGINQQQESKLRSPLDMLLRVLHLSEFGRPVPEGFAFDFEPLWQMKDEDKAEVASKVATSMGGLMSAGIIGRKTALEELRQSSHATGIFASITNEEIESAEEDPPDISEGGEDEGGEPGGGDDEQTQDAGISKQAVNYSPGNVTRRCGICIHYDGDGGCRMVAGDIDPYYWCKLFRLKGTQDGLPQFEVHGMPVVIETPKGAERKGDGWTRIMPEHYGYIRGTDSAEGRDEQMDCFVGPNPKSKRVWVIDSLDEHGRLFDEHKCCLGFDDEESALDCFLESYGHDHTRLGGVTRMTVEGFKKWLADGDHTQPLSRR